MKKISFTKSERTGHKANLGLIVLKADETIEHEFNYLIRDPGVALYVTRLSSRSRLTTNSLKSMESRISSSVSLLPSALTFDVIAYACTSGASLIGPKVIDRLIRSSINVMKVTEPLTSLVAACNFLGLRRLSIVTPYVFEISSMFFEALRSYGIEIVSFGSFEQAEEHIVAQIDQKSVLDAAVQVDSGSNSDAVFLSCTNLRTIDIIEKAEKKLNKPVISSNQALAWHMLQDAGIAQYRHGVGKLMQDFGY